MAENSGDLSLGYMMGQSEGNSGGFGNFGEGLWAVIILAILFGRGGFGFGGGGGGEALTRAGLYDGFAIQNIDSAVRNVQNGIADATYALNNSVTSGFHGLTMQLADCCCTTQRAIDGVNYNMAKGFCDLGNVINMQTRDIIDNQNANYRGLMDFLVSEKLASKDARIVELTNQLSQSNQNAVIGARIDAAVAEVLRRTGNDCPTAAYIVQPPTPVNFPTNGCGTVQFGNWQRENYGGCGCGC